MSNNTDTPENSDVLTLAKALIACRSVTPADEGAQATLEHFLSPLGFTCHHVPFGKIKNLYARLGDAGPHLCYAGHTDVVPPGYESGWTSPPFEPTVRDGKLYGRGAADMKGSVAAFATAAKRFVEKHGAPQGSISMLITGDEEAEAIDGTEKVLAWMKDNNHTPDVALVGEPTNPSEHGQEMKIGRRGSLTGILSAKGRQGHVAYPERSDNPMPRLIKMLDILATHPLDKGTDYFQPSNLEITTVDVGNPADNVTPESGRAVFNIRFNDQWTHETLEAELRRLLDMVAKDYVLETIRGSKSFMTQPGDWSEIVRDSVADICGRTPAYTTTGGTSDARFVQAYCPVIEYGGVNASIHQTDEHIGVEELEILTQIYVRVMERYFNIA